MKPFLCYPWVGEPLATVGPLRWIPGRVRIGSKPIAEVTPIRQADTLGFWFQRLLFENMKKGLDLNLRRAKSPILNGSIFVSHRLGRECASASAMLPTVRLRLGLFFFLRSKIVLAGRSEGATLNSPGRDEPAKREKTP